MQATNKLSDKPDAVKTAAELSAATAELHSILDYAASKLPPKSSAALDALLLRRRVFIGETGSLAIYDEGSGAHVPTRTYTDSLILRHTTRTMAAALAWGCPFVLYWEYYDNYSTEPVVPRTDTPYTFNTVLRTWFVAYFTAARAYLEHAATRGEPTDLSAWAAGYFNVPENDHCISTASVPFLPGAPAGVSCCDAGACAVDDSCASGVYRYQACYWVRSTNPPPPPSPPAPPAPPPPPAPFSCSDMSGMTNVRPNQWCNTKAARRNALDCPKFYVGVDTSVWPCYYDAPTGKCLKRQDSIDCP